jgi:tRNA-splicing ligase RtcB (3'-phosphate/5'-hydroxy nucleic acid ligase)
VSALLLRIVKRKKLHEFVPVPAGSFPVKAWIRDVPVEEAALKQLAEVASLPFIHKWVAAMPDVHFGRGATVGSVIATKKAIIPAAVGVDVGCGMMALRTSLKASQLPDDLKHVRFAIEKAVPHGRSHQGKRNDRGAWKELPQKVMDVWTKMSPGYQKLIDQHSRLGIGNDVSQLGTLGTGNHFIEVCIDEAQAVWIMLHSGSRGVGNRIGTYFIELAKKDMGDKLSSLPNGDLAYLNEGTRYFDDYFSAVEWAQNFAKVNRQLMMDAIIAAMQSTLGIAFGSDSVVIDCHHNYASRETHYGSDVFVTRKGAVRARLGEWGIIPGSMGAKSFIVKGLGNPESFESCSHGAGRCFSRSEARRRFTLAEHEKATRGIECRKDSNIIDETPAAYKDIEKVMAAQVNLVEVVHTLKQVVVVKG